jgi:hypothetical protein
MVKTTNIPLGQQPGKVRFEALTVALLHTEAFWDVAMSLGEPFLTFCGITVPPSSKVKMKVPQSFEMSGTTLNTVSHTSRPESSTRQKVPNFILSKLCTGCPKN